MAYIFGQKQTAKMGLSLLHSPLNIRANKSSCTGLCWLMQTLFHQSNHDGMSISIALQISACNSCFMYYMDPKQKFLNSL